MMCMGLPITVIFLLGPPLWLLFKLWQRGGNPEKHTAAVLVLGDIGRSPRMMYHAESIAKLGFGTFLIGYDGAKVTPSLSSIPHVQFVYLKETPHTLRRLPFLLLAPIKVLIQVCTILDALLLQIPRPPEFILVQNPPTIPTLALVLLVSKLRGSKVIIDWHNLGYSILALKLGKRHILVRIAKWFEATFGRSAYAHLFVTEAMKGRLSTDWGLIGEKVVLHDRPPPHFHSASPVETHELLIRLSPVLLKEPDMKSFLPQYSLPQSTPFTQVIKTFPTNGRSLSTQEYPMPISRRDRPALLVTSTSWTPDEDFGLLLRALEGYESRAQATNGLPKVLMMITGRGPLRGRYMEEVKKKQEKWRWVRCISVWLEAEDYPILLGSSDLGISLHSSSSGLDLPMKVVDMFGSGLPVCALNFSCLDELVKDGVNGLVFKDSEQLTQQLVTLLTSFPNSQPLKKLRQTVRNATDDRRHPTSWEWGSWDDNWNKHVRPLLLHTNSPR